MEFEIMLTKPFRFVNRGRLAILHQVFVAVRIVCWTVF